MKLLYAFWQVLVAVAAPFLFLNVPSLSQYMSDSHIATISSGYFLVVLFILFMQIVLASYLPAKPIEVLWLLLLPFISAAILQVQYAEGLVYLAEVSALLVASYMLAYTVLVWVMPWFEKEKPPLKEYLLISSVQLLFIVPGLLTSMVFAEVMWSYGMGQGYTAFSWLLQMVLFYVLPLVHHIAVFLPRMKEQSIYA